MKDASHRIDSELPYICQNAVLRIESEAKRIVYLGHEKGHLERRTGTLQRSITTETNVSEETVVSTVGTNVVYAPQHELGLTVPNKNGGYTHFPPRPFLQPAFESKKEDVRSRIFAAVKDIFEEEVL